MPNNVTFFGNNGNPQALQGGFQVGTKGPTLTATVTGGSATGYNAHASVTQQMGPNAQLQVQASNFNHTNPQGPHENQVSAGVTFGFGSKK